MTQADKAFVIAVKKRLIDVDMKKKELAKAIGASEQYFSMILRGLKPPGKYEAAIRRVLDMPLEDIKVAV